LVKEHILSIKGLNPRL